MTDLSERLDQRTEALVSHIDNITHRSDGPGYLFRGSLMDVGVLRLGPGEATLNHFHHRLDEVFLVLEGQASMWIDGTKRVPLVPGASYLSRAREMHYFVNDSVETFRAFFVKSPYDQSDTNPIPWEPGLPVPRISDPGDAQDGATSVGAHPTASAFRRSQPVLGTTRLILPRPAGPNASPEPGSR